MDIERIASLDQSPGVLPAKQSNSMQEIVRCVIEEINSVRREWKEEMKSFAQKLEFLNQAYSRLKNGVASKGIESIPSIKSPLIATKPSTNMFYCKSCSNHFNASSLTEMNKFGERKNCNNVQNGCSSVQIPLHALGLDAQSNNTSNENINERSMVSEDYFSFAMKLMNAEETPLPQSEEQVNVNKFSSVQPTCNGQFEVFSMVDNENRTNVINRKKSGNMPVLSLSPVLQLSTSASSIRPRRQQIRKLVDKRNKITGQNMIPCSTSSLAQSNNRRRKNATTTKRKPLYCKICNRLFWSVESLNNHSKLHSGLKPYQCRLCNESFFDHQSLKFHVISHENSKPFACQICGKRFTTEAYCKMHVRTHYNEHKRHFCEKCNKVFAQIGDLKRHMFTHMEEKTFACNQCEKLFKSKKILSRHLKIHSNKAKSFKCQICEKFFATNSSLMKHLRLHTGEKPFKCELCLRSFSQNGTLKIHMRSHTGEKPYPCPHCEKRFALKHHLKAHSSIHKKECAPDKIVV